MNLVAWLRFAPLAGLGLIAWGYQADLLADPMFWTPVTGLMMLPLAEGVLEEAACDCGTPERIQATVGTAFCPGCGA